MKAFLMAAGLGTRLKPITNLIPKCLVPINNKPLLQYWIDLFEKYNVTEVLINTHYLNTQVEDYIKSYTGPIKFTVSYEPQLLGSGGTLYNNQNFITSDEPFLICYADNLTNIDLNKIVEFYKNQNTILSMGVFHTTNPSACGIAQIENSIITNFIEKPQTNIYGDLANAGIYVTNKDIFHFITNRDFDIGKDILPKLINNMSAYDINCYLLDIGTIENLNRARREVYDYF